MKQTTKISPGRSDKSVVTVITTHTPEDWYATEVLDADEKRIGYHRAKGDVFAAIRAHSRTVTEQTINVEKY